MYILRFYVTCNTVVVLALQEQRCVLQETYARRMFNVTCHRSTERRNDLDYVTRSGSLPSQRHTKHPELPASVTGILNCRPLGPGLHLSASQTQHVSERGAALGTLVG